MSFKSVILAAAAAAGLSLAAAGGASAVGPIQPLAVEGASQFQEVGYYYQRCWWRRVRYYDPYTYRYYWRRVRVCR